MIFPKYKQEITSGSNPIHDLIIEAYYNRKKVNYIIVGDSLRAGSTVTGLYPYYRTVFSSLNIDVYLSATAGLYTDVWRANTSPSTQARLSYTVANCIGDGGADTIIEWSLGVNDHSVHGAANVKAELKQGILDLLLQKPNVKIVLVVPTISGTLQRGLDLLASYTELAAELGLPLVNGFEATKHVYPYPPLSFNAYYTEATHINDNGGRRIFNYILNKIIPPGIGWVFQLPEFSGIESETALINQAVVETGSYQSTGTPISGATWRRLDEVTVVGRTLIKLQHKGTRRDIIWKDASNVHTVQNLPVLLPDVPYWLIEVPETAITVKVNIETVDGAAYDALLDTPILQNVVPITSYIMPKEKINIGLNLRIK